MIKIIQIDLKIFASDRWFASDPHPIGIDCNLVKFTSKERTHRWGWSSCRFACLRLFRILPARCAQFETGRRGCLKRIQSLVCTHSPGIVPRSRSLERRLHYPGVVRVTIVRPFAWQIRSFSRRRRRRRWRRRRSDRSLMRSPARETFLGIVMAGKRKTVLVPILHHILCVSLLLK